MPATFSTDEKSVPKGKRDQSKRRASYQPKFTAHGRPGKRTPQLEKDLLAAIATGAPYRIACQAVGISEDSFIEWRRKDPEFAQRVEKAAGQTALRLLKKIEARADDNFSAAAWMLERRYPEVFSRPEVQIGIQTNINTQGANGHNLESIIVSDLEFLKLREHENYEHRRHERQVREVEATVSSVPEDLSGVLKVVNHPGSAVISESQARESRRRVEKADEAIEQLLKSRRTGNGNGATGFPEVPTVVHATVSAPITKPVGEPSPGWWGQLTSGSGEREIERATAVKVVRTIMADVFGQLRSQNTPVEFAPDAPILLRDVHSVLQDLCGPKGWAALTKRSEV